MTGRSIAGLAVVLMLTATDALAQQREFYDTRTGRSVGRSTTDSSGAVTFYGTDGRVTGRTSTGSDGAVTIYGADGRKTGTIAPQHKGKP